MASNNVTPARAINVTEGSGDNAVVMNSSASGNLSFEVVLSPARVIASPRAAKFMQSPVVAASSRLLEDIAAKLKMAEENRERLMDEKLEKIKEHEKHIEEIRKMHEVEAQRNLEKTMNKLAKADELRQQHLENLVEKCKEHEKHVEQVRKNVATKGESNGDELDDTTASREMVAQEKQEHNGTTNGNAKENLIP
jgi:hypothetical protein